MMPTLVLVQLHSLVQTHQAKVALAGEARAREQTTFTLADMYARQYGTQLQKEQAAFSEMKRAKEREYAKAERARETKGADDRRRRHERRWQNDLARPMPSNLQVHQHGIKD